MNTICIYLNSKLQEFETVSIIDDYTVEQHRNVQIPGLYIVETARWINEQYLTDETVVVDEKWAFM